MICTTLDGLINFFAARPGWVRSLLAFGVFALALGLYYFGLHHLTHATLTAQDVIFGSDTQEIVEALLHPTFENDMRKHVLFSVTLAPVIQLFDLIPLVSILRAMRLVLALLAALNVMGVFLILQAENPAQDALLFTGMYAVAFANLVIYSIPETYAMSNFWIIVYLLALFMMRNKLDGQSSLMFSVLAGLAALYNTPLLSLVGIHILLRFRRMRFWQWMRAGLGNLAVAVSILLAANLLVYGTDIFSFWRGYSSQWASPFNLLNPAFIATVFVDFYLFSIASPVGYLPFGLGWQDWPAYWQTPLGALLALLVPATLGAGLVIAFQRRNSFDLALLAWVGVMTLFYIYFNPLEAMLYASLILAPLMIVLSRTMQNLPIPAKFRRGIVLALVLALAVNNLSALLAGVPEA